MLTAWAGSSRKVRANRRGFSLCIYLHGMNGLFQTGPAPVCVGEAGRTTHLFGEGDRSHGSWTDGPLGARAWRDRPGGIAP